MNKIITLLILLAMGFQIRAQEVPSTPEAPPAAEAPPTAEAPAAPETPAAPENPDQGTVGDSVDITFGNLHIRVSEDGENVDLSVGDWNLTVDDQGNVTIQEEEDEDDELEVVRTKFMLIDLGVSSWLNEGSFNLPEDQRSLENLNYWRSANVDLYIFRQRISLIKQVLNLEYGLGFSWNLYNFRDNVSITPNADFTDVLPIEMDLKKSRLTTTHLTVPLLMVIETNPTRHGRSFRIGAGPYGSLRTGSKTVYKSTDKQKVKTKDDFNLNPLRWGVQGRVGFGSFNLFVNYSVTEMFRDGQGPELNPIAFGLTIHGF